MAWRASGNAAAAVCAALSSGGCGHDWDPFDPRGTAAASGSTAGTGGETAGAGGQGGGTGGAGATGGASGGAGGGGGSGGAGPVSCNKMSMVADDFDDGAIHPRWSEITNLGTITEGNGALIVALPTTPAETSYDFLESLRYFDLTESQVSVRVVDSGGGAAGGVWLSVDFAGNTWADIYLAGGELAARRELGGVLETLAAVPYDPGSHAYWRIREQAGTFYWETSPDGTSFDELASVPAAEMFALDLVTTQLGAWTAAGSPGADAVVFDDFNGGTPVGAHCAIAGLSDDFDDGVPDRIWLRGGDYGGAVISEATGALLVTPPSEPDAGYGFYLSASAWDMTGGAIEVEVVSAPNPSTSAEMLMGIDDSQGNSVEFLLTYGVLHCRRWEDGQYQQPFANQTYEADEHRFWRMRESGGDVLCETSPDRQAWTLLGETPVFFPPSAVDVFLTAGTYRPQAAPGTGGFEDFNVAP